MAQTKQIKTSVYQLIYSGFVGIFKHDILRYPKLDTVLMIEKAAKDAKSDLTVRQLWKSLPKKVMWQTYLTTIDYLEYSGKIIIDKDKTVIWIWAPKQIASLKRRGLVHDSAP